MIKKAALVMVYGLYAVVLTAVLLVVRFPENLFLDWAAARVAGELPGFTCTIEQATYLYPFNLRLDRITLVNASELLEIPVSEVLITVNPKRPLAEAGVTAKLFRGSIGADVIIHRSAHAVELANLQISDIDLGSVEPLERRLQRPIQGQLSFSGQFIGSRGDLLNGELSGNTRLTDLHLVLRRPILQNNSVDFNELGVVSRLQNGKLMLSEGQASGLAYDGRFSGQISLSRQLQESELDISGELIPHQDFLDQNRQAARAVALLKNKYGSDAIPYRISGSFREPVFTFGNEGG